VHVGFGGPGDRTAFESRCDTRWMEGEAVRAELPAAAAKMMQAWTHVKERLRSPMQKGWRRMVRDGRVGRGVQWREVRGGDGGGGAKVGAQGRAMGSERAAERVAGSFGPKLELEATLSSTRVAKTDL
jgi:hypothetical protein